MQRLTPRTGFILTGALIVAAFFVLRSGKPTPTGGSEDACDLVAGYGSIFETPSNNEIKANAETRPELLEKVRKCADGLLEKEHRAKADQLIETLGDQSETTDGRVERSIVEIEIMAALSGSEPLLEQRDIARRLVENLAEVTEIVEHQQATEILDVSTRWSPPSKQQFRAEVPQYQKMCRDAGVPVPGSFADDDKWTEAADVSAETPDFFFLSNLRYAKLFTYRGDNKGFCIALVRRDSDTDDTIPFVGTICVDKAQNNACFFDNSVYDDSVGTRRLSWKEFQQTDFSQFVHPKDGDDICSRCHVGENPFIVHPKSALGKTVQSMYDKEEPTLGRFEFLGLTSKPDPWINFQSIVKDGTNADKCLGCHDLPAVTSNNSFCGIFKRAATQTMPPEHRSGHVTAEPYLWPDENGCFPKGLEKLSNYFASVRKLRSICTGRVVPACENTTD